MDGGVFPLAIYAYRKHTVDADLYWPVCVLNPVQRLRPTRNPNSPRSSSMSNAARYAACVCVCVEGRGGRVGPFVSVQVCFLYRLDRQQPCLHGSSCLLLRFGFAAQKTLVWLPCHVRSSTLCTTTPASAERFVLQQPQKHTHTHMHAYLTCLLDKS